MGAAVTPTDVRDRGGAPDVLVRVGKAFLWLRMCSLMPGMLARSWSRRCVDTATGR